MVADRTADVVSAAVRLPLGDAGPVVVVTTRVVCDRVQQIAAACTEPTPARGAITAALDDVSRIESWAAARRGDLVRMLGALPGSFPEADIAEATGCTLNAASNESDRSKMLDHAEAFADALDAGDIRPGHVDALTRTTRNLTVEQAATLLDQQEHLAGYAASVSIKDFEQHLRRMARGLQTEADADARLERQQRNTRLRYWVDPADDMWCMTARFDPQTGGQLRGLIDGAVTSLFAESTPATAPADRLERQQHLNALAVARLVAGKAPTPTKRGAPVLVVDATTAGEPPKVDSGISAELPLSVMRDIFDTTEPDTVIVANGIVLYAPGTLNLGRTTRLANRDQRRALSGLYSSCSIPGCAVHYERCKLHHVIWWRNGGKTDLDNLIPVCQHHHTRLHNDGWHLTLGPNRELTVRFADGNVLRTGPPRRSAA